MCMQAILYEAMKKTTVFGLEKLQMHPFLVFLEALGNFNNDRNSNLKNLDKSIQFTQDYCSFYLVFKFHI